MIAAYLLLYRVYNYTYYVCAAVFTYFLTLSMKALALATSLSTARDWKGARHLEGRYIDTTYMYLYISTCTETLSGLKMLTPNMNEYGTHICMTKHLAIGTDTFP